MELKEKYELPKVIISFESFEYEDARKYLESGEDGMIPSPLTLMVVLLSNWGF